MQPRYQDPRELLVRHLEYIKNVSANHFERDYILTYFVCMLCVCVCLGCMGATVEKSEDTLGVLAPPMGTRD